MKKRKLVLIGLDCASPNLVFNRFKDNLPNISKLMKKGVYGNLRSSMPPITVPAWMVMLTGQNPGKLGLYGFRHRKAYSYSDIWIANSRSISEPKVWDYLETYDLKTCLFAIPPSYPPPVVNGCSIGCFLTPSNKSDYAYPPSLKNEIETIIGPYIPDLELRSGDLAIVQDLSNKMLENHKKIIKHMLTTKSWDFFAFNEIGVDRLHHAFWRYLDETHPKYTKDSQFKNVIRDYYLAIDAFIGEILELVSDDTYILIVSDHGAKASQGAICINEWFRQEGYLTLKENIVSPNKLDTSQVDWTKTKAWGWGGYYSRVFLNVQGREEKGIITKTDYKTELTTLQEKIMSITDSEGKPMANLAINPSEYFESVKKDFPDLMVIFDDLNWRVSDVVGTKSIYSDENHTAAGDAVHDWDGIFILYDPKMEITQGNVSARIEDITPTIFYLLTDDILENIDGKVIDNVKK